MSKSISAFCPNVPTEEQRRKNMITATRILEA
jgi:hypothetical protein